MRSLFGEYCLQCGGALLDDSRIRRIESYSEAPDATPTDADVAIPQIKAQQIGILRVRKL
jgi:hypothetical protein